MLPDALGFSRKFCSRRCTTLSADNLLLYVVYRRRRFLGEVRCALARKNAAAFYVRTLGKTLVTKQRLLSF